MVDWIEKVWASVNAYYDAVRIRGGLEALIEVMKEEHDNPELIERYEKTLNKAKSVESEAKQVRDDLVKMQTS